VMLSLFLNAALAVAVVLVAACALVLTWWRIERAGRRVVSRSGDAIVVFGAQAADGRPSSELEARLRFAAVLYRDARAPVILCSGGHAGPQSEPRVMRRALVTWGVPDSDILIDEQGSSTRRSIAAAKHVAPGRWGRVLLVSSPYHIHRICREARRQGLSAVGCPAPATPVMRCRRTRRRQMLREVAATWWYGAFARTPSWLLKWRWTADSPRHLVGTVMPERPQATAICADAAAASHVSTNPASVSSSTKRCCL
jgi:uncharacterized SAM-binding protein YcdF (DUF218 family)